MDKLPNSYLRWMVTQEFPKEWLDFAKEKLAKSSFDNRDINISRHAIDMFSTRFINLWLNSIERTNNMGIGTFVAILAQDAWDKGKDTSQHRTKDDGLRRDYAGMRFVFNVSPHFPEYKDVITIMGTD